MSRSKVKYKHIAENAIKLFQKMEKEEDNEVHSYEEWLALLEGELKEDEQS